MEKWREEEEEAESKAAGKEERIRAAEWRR